MPRVCRLVFPRMSAPSRGLSPHVWVREPRLVPRWKLIKTMCGKIQLRVDAQNEYFLSFFFVSKCQYKRRGRWLCCGKHHSRYCYGCISCLARLVDISSVLVIDPPKPVPPSAVSLSVANGLPLDVLEFIDFPLTQGGITCIHCSVSRPGFFTTR